MKSFFSNKRVFVTGGCGTVGRVLVGQLLRSYNVGELIAIDNNETDLFFLEQEYADFPNASFFLGDVRDRDKLTRKMNGVNLVFHAAAFKHVILCERSPSEAIQTNILGVQNIIYAASENNVERVLFTSSDKAVNPTNVMGTSKLMGERLMTAANSSARNGRPVFASTRFGNVLGSRGSVIPIFRDQISHGGPVTLTHGEMTRFVMSINEAVQLIIDSAQLACGGEVFVTKMPAVCIKDLAEIMIQELAPFYGFRPQDIAIENIGVKPGEKMYEELMNLEEIRRAWELQRYFVVTPAFSNIYNQIQYDYPEIKEKSVEKPYNSENEPMLPKEKLADFLRTNNLLCEDDPDVCPMQVQLPEVND